MAFEPGECLLARRDGGGGLVAAGRIEVVARTDGGEPLLVTREVSVGFLQLGVGGTTAASLELELLLELASTLDYLVVLVGPFAPARVDDRRFLLGVGQANTKHFAVAALGA